MNTVIKLILFLALVSSSVVFSVSPDEENLGIVMRENREYLKYINVCVSNLSSPQPETKDAAGNVQAPDFKDNPYYEIMKNANQYDFNGTLWYFQGKYGLANKPFHDSQKEIKELYRLALEKYLVSTRATLEYAAPFIIRTNDIVAKNLLKLGFRELKRAEDSYTKSLNEAPYQYRKKIVQYQQGISSARLGRKFGILAIIASKTPDEDKDEFRFRDLDEVMAGAQKQRYSDYIKIQNTLKTYISTKIIERKIKTIAGKDQTEFDVLELHDDNYLKMAENRISLLKATSKEVKAGQGYADVSVPDRPDTSGKAE